MKKEVGISFGILCPEIKEQLLEQGFTISEKEIERFENLRKSCNMVAIHGLATDSQQAAMFQKLLKQIIKSIRPVEQERD